MSSFGGNIYTLSLCPAIDTTLYLEEIGLDRELPVHREHSEAGGKGANTAAALAVQGVDCACICLMGEENAGLFLHLLDDAGVRCVPIPLPGRIRENLSLETPQGQYRVMRQGFRADRRALGRLEMVLRERLRPGDTVLVGGKLPEGIAADDLAALCERIHSLGAEVTLDTAAVRLAQVERIRPLVIKPNRLELGEITGLAALCERIHSLGAEVTLDTAAVRLAQVERIRPLVIKPNRLELGEITGLPTGDLSQCVEAARLLHQHGAQRVLVSLDRDGAFLLDQEGLLLAQAPEVEVPSCWIRRGCCWPRPRRWKSAALWEPVMPCWHGSQRPCLPAVPGKRPCAGLWQPEVLPACTMAPMPHPARRWRRCCRRCAPFRLGTLWADRAYTVSSGDSPVSLSELERTVQANDRDNKTN